jgi:hypothetical protein
MTFKINTNCAYRWMAMAHFRASSSINTQHARIKKGETLNVIRLGILQADLGIPYFHHMKVTQNEIRMGNSITSKPTVSDCCH